nr:RhoGAP [Hymenolepis microstoma]
MKSSLMNPDERRPEKYSTKLGLLSGSKRGRSLSPVSQDSKKRRASPMNWLMRRKSFEVKPVEPTFKDLYTPMEDSWAEPKTPTKDESIESKGSPSLTPSSTIIITSAPASSDFFDDDLVQPDRSLKDLRAYYGRQFVSLVSLYLKNIEIHLKDLDLFVKDIHKDEASCRTLIGSSNRPPSPIAKVLKVCRSIATDDAKKQYSNEWYRISYIMINYLINEKRYRYKQIFRRNAVVRHVKLLETEMLHRIRREERPLVSKECVLKTGDEITKILSQYDAGAVANVLTRILKASGPLFPEKLHYLLRQLYNPKVNFTPENEGKITVQCRALRLLLQLAPSNHLEYIYRPLGHLLALITEDPVCEVKPEDTGVLFGPTFMVSDNAPLSDLQDAKNFYPVRLLVEISKKDMPPNGSNITGPFRLPSLFLADCQNNLYSLQTETSPAMKCSFRYNSRGSLDSCSGKSPLKSPKRKLFDWSSPSEVQKPPKPKLQPPTPLFDTTNLESPLSLRTPKNRLNSPRNFPIKRNVFGQGPLKSHLVSGKSTGKQGNTH